ncbi:MAG: glyoxalase/bleomycin resistance/dioxygenase family protein [Gemmatimonadales bacterium]
MDAPRQSLVVFAKKKAPVSAFYLQTLGLTTIESEPSHDLLRGPGIELVIHAIPAEYAADIAIATPPERREDAAFKPAFLVEDLEAVRRAALATGGFLEPKARAWRMGNAVVLDGTDPEGNVVQFRQSGSSG